MGKQHGDSRCLIKVWQDFLFKCLQGVTGAIVTAVILERNSKEEVTVCFVFFKETPIGSRLKQMALLENGLHLIQSNSALG